MSSGDLMSRFDIIIAILALIYFLFAVKFFVELGKNQNILCGMDKSYCLVKERDLLLS